MLTLSECSNSSWYKRGSEPKMVPRTGRSDLTEGQPERQFNHFGDSPLYSYQNLVVKPWHFRSEHTKCDKRDKKRRISKLNFVVACIWTKKDEMKGISNSELLQFPSAQLVFKRLQKFFLNSFRRCSYLCFHLCVEPLCINFQFLFFVWWKRKEEWLGWHKLSTFATNTQIWFCSVECSVPVYVPIFCSTKI